MIADFIRRFRSVKAATYTRSYRQTIYGGVPIMIRHLGPDANGGNRYEIYKVPRGFYFHVYQGCFISQVAAAGAPGAFVEYLPPGFSHLGTTFAPGNFQGGAFQFFGGPIAANSALLLAKDCYIPEGSSIRVNFGGSSPVLNSFLVTLSGLLIPNGYRQEISIPFFEAQEF